MAGNGLAEWLNRNSAAKTVLGPAVEAYVRWWKGGHRRNRPRGADALFSRPFAGTVSRTAYGLDIIGRGHDDIAIWYVVVLSRSEGLSRMRECRNCGKWFFARNRKSKYHDDACRSAYDATHNGKERAAFNNRKWRIEKLYLPDLSKRIARLENLDHPTRQQVDRLERVRKRLDNLEKELLEINRKLRQRRKQ